MQTKLCYYAILSVYILLCSCQVIICHLTHSLIILTDSYINLFKILDISLGILHLNTQQKVQKCETNKLNKNGNSKLVNLFSRECTYQFKRLPVLGSFVNGLFLAALLMSAAIEGIQTCFHASHLSVEGDKSILLEHPITYPGILLGFALIDLIMQWCSSRAHEMREDELEAESLLELRSNLKTFDELDVEKLGITSNNQQMLPIGAYKSNDNQSVENPKLLAQTQVLEQKEMSLSLHPLIRSKSFESVPLDSNDTHAQISLKSLKMSPNLESETSINMKSITNDLPMKVTKSNSIDGWLLVRIFVSPVALTICALTVYFINDELVTEIADAFLAIMVVILLFRASYPPMEKASRILLQSVPDPVDVEVLKGSIRSVSKLILDVRELHVWSLTARTNRVATCKIILHKEQIHSEEELANLITEVRYKFLDYNIKCPTIEPSFLVLVTDKK